MNLLDAKSLDELLIVLQDSFLNDFQVDFCNLLLVAREEDFPVTNISVCSLDEASQKLGEEIIEVERAYFGELTESQRDVLYGSQANLVESSAVVPVRQDTLCAVLAIGSRSPDHFHKNLDTLFLGYISETLGRLVPIMMDKEQGNCILSE